MAACYIVISYSQHQHHKFGLIILWSIKIQRDNFALQIKDAQEDTDSPTHRKRSRPGNSQSPTPNKIIYGKHFLNELKLGLIWVLLL